MDRHELQGASAADAAAAHVQDVAVQERFGVQYLNYWFDYERQTAFCLAKGPDRDAVEAVHRASHGILAHHIIEVDEQAVRRFMGRVVEHPLGEPYVRDGLPSDPLHRHRGIDAAHAAAR
jgi:hypothetical protein